jgi:hypothetical protein
VKRRMQNVMFVMRQLRSVCSLAWILLALGCANVPIEYGEPPPDFWLAVIDFRVPDAWRNPEMPDAVRKDFGGWWFSSRGLFHNPGLGRVGADAFSRQLSRLSFIHNVSRVDIKYYMADKRERIKTVLQERQSQLEKSANPREQKEAQRIQTMSEADYDRMVERLPAREVGKELKADRVLVGRIHDAYLAHNRTIHWYWSFVDLEINLVDVDTGNIVWHKRAQYKKNFASTAFVLDIAAQDMVEMMKREYFYQP